MGWRSFLQFHEHLDFMPADGRIVIVDPKSYEIVSIVTL
ncbi:MULTISPECIES: DUF1236 domain-containing protein [Chelatococcus]|nr:MULTISPECIES: DUF1236 domain-containing protein [Chelatococcus]